MSGNRRGKRGGRGPAAAAASDGDGAAAMTRIAIVSREKCRPRRCAQECKRRCPVVQQGKLCIEVTNTSKVAFLSEELCIGCGICTKACPFQAISIINLPSDLAANTTHRYGANSFKLHRLPMPRPGQVLGLVGTNGIGKSTALKILAGKLKPNLGRYETPPEWRDVITHFRGSTLQSYFESILEENLKAIIKPQYVDHIPKAVQGRVSEIMESKDQRNVREEVYEMLDMENFLDGSVDVLSGGELQRFAIGVVAVQRSHVYMFDEPSSYLDVKQRLKAAAVIRSIVGEQAEDASSKFVLVVEHDLAVLDYLSDYVCCLYGTPSAYGVVTMPFSVREGINIFLAGFVPTENLRFREEELTFRVAQTADEGLENAATAGTARYQYPAMTKTLTHPKTGRTFLLHLEPGTFSDSEIIVMLGENGTGKTTFIRMLAGLLKSDEQEQAEAAAKASVDAQDFGENEEAAQVARDMALANAAAEYGVPRLNVSYKPQKISPKFGGTVRQLLHKKIRDSYVHPQFVSDVMRPLNMDDIIDQSVQNLSGGELQRTAIVLALGMPADVYLVDEPSAYLDSEQRISAGKVIRRFIMHAKKTAFVVEHDFIMATYLADRVVVYEGTPGIEATATAPQGLLTGMNRFLAMLEITFRRDPTNFRPRINKHDSVKDREQKESGNYFFMDDEG